MLVLDKEASPSISLAERKLSIWKGESTPVPVFHGSRRVPASRHPRRRSNLGVRGVRAGHLKAATSEGPLDQIRSLKSSPGLKDLGYSPLSLNIGLPLGSVVGRLIQHGVNSVGIIARIRGQRRRAGIGGLVWPWARPCASDLRGAQRGLGGTADRFPY